MQIAIVVTASAHQAGCFKVSIHKEGGPRRDVDPLTSQEANTWVSGVRAGLEIAGYEVTEEWPGNLFSLLTT